MTSQLNQTETKQAESDPHAWAEHLDYMEGLEISDSVGAPSATGASRMFGVALCLGIAGVGVLLSQLPLAVLQTPEGRPLLDPVFLSILLGILLCQFLPGATTSARPGIKWVTRFVLPAGIVLLGARLNLGDLVAVGLAGVLCGFLVVWGALWLFLGPVRRWFGLEPRMGLLLGVGTGICGGTAIVAVGPILKAKEEEIVTGVAAVTLVGLGAMLLFPLIAPLLSIPQAAFGFWAGLSIHQTPQAVAAGFAYGEESGTLATLTKLARVCLLAPVAILCALLVSKNPARFGLPDGALASQKRRWIPPFVIGFLLLALARTAGLLPEIQVNWDFPWLQQAVQSDFSLLTMLHLASIACIAAGMAAIGLETRPAALLRAGKRGLFAVLVVSVGISVVALGLAFVLF